MKITIHQVICGEKNKGWDLLSSSLTDTIVARKIAFKADLQDTPPTGINWEPVLRGFKSDDNFVFIKTFPDLSEDVRKGRVFSHCLIISLKDLQYLDDINLILALFKTEIDKNLETKPIIVETVNNNKYQIPEELNGRFNKVIKAFLKFNEQEGTIVWVGQNHYEDALKRYWQLLSQSEREKFNFGINFNSNQIPSGTINFITIPSSLENKFANSAICLVSQNDSVELTDFSEQFLAGEVTANKKLDSFLKEIGSRIISRNEIDMVAKGLKTYDKLHQIDDLKLLVTLANIIIELSPDPLKGRNIKKQVTERICAVVEKINQKDLILMKTFKVDYFEGSKYQISNAINLWMKTNAFDIESNRSNDYSELIKLVYQTTVKDSTWWHSNIKKQIRDFICNLNNTSVVVFYSWLLKDIDVLALLEKDINKSADSEKLLTDNLPKKIETNDTWLNDIKKFAAKYNFFRLYASIIRVQFTFKKSITELLLIDKEEDHFEGIQILTEKIPESEIITSALELSDKRLITISGKLCYENPILLNHIDLTIPVWINIWAQAIEQGNKLEDGIINIENKIGDIFNLILNGGTVNEILLSKISESPYSSILKHPQRNLLWRKFNNKHKHPILNATFSDLIDNSTNASWSNQTLDIKDEILRHENLPFILKKSSTRNVLWLFNNTQGFGEGRLIEFLNARFESFSSSDCSTLGIIINKGRYESAFNLINGTLIKKNSNFNRTISLTADTFKKLVWEGFFKAPSLKVPKKNYNTQKKIKILFLSANPISTPRLRVDAELACIDDALKSSKSRDRFDLENKGAVRLDTFSASILENNPEIIHFSGHADKEGIALEDKDGQTKVLANIAIDQIFKLFKNKVKCVVLNACYSENQAKIISKHGIYVVGMNDEINDDVAINFSVGFYLGIVNGKDPVFSYNFAKTKVLAENTSSSSIPVLWYNGEKIGEEKSESKTKEKIEKDKGDKKQTKSKKYE